MQIVGYTTLAHTLLQVVILYFPGAQHGLPAGGPSVDCLRGPLRRPARAAAHRQRPRR